MKIFVDLQLIIFFLDGKRFFGNPRRVPNESPFTSNCVGFVQGTYEAAETATRASSEIDETTTGIKDSRTSISVSISDHERCQ